MNPINFIVRGINQLKLTDIITLVLLITAIIDFHWHINTSKKRKESDTSENKDHKELADDKVKSIFVTWDYKIRKPILSIKIQGDKYLLIALSKEDTATLLEQLNSFQDNKNYDKINVLDPEVQKDTQFHKSNLNKDKIEIPVALYKKYQQNEVKLEKLEDAIKQAKKATK